jgi:hypothetical protein
VTGGGSFVHTGGAAQYSNAQNVMGSTTALSNSVLSLAGTGTGVAQLKTKLFAAQTADVWDHYDSDGTTLLMKVTTLGQGLGLQPSGDATGVKDTAYINAAIAQLGSQGGTVLLAPGNFYWLCGQVSITTTFVTVRGAGRWATQVNAVGTGDCLRVYNTDTTGLLTGGALLDFTIDGTGAGAGSCGLHYGDMRAGELRLAVRNFTGAGSINVLFDNQYGWTEECLGYLWLSNGTQNLVFNVSAPAGGPYTATNASPAVFTCASPTFTNGTQVVLSGGSPPTGFSNGTGYFVVSASGTTFQLAATFGGTAINSTSTGSGTVTQATSTNSFGYMNLDVQILAKQNQDGLVVQNGALLYNSPYFGVRGNFQGTPGANTSAAIRITGTVPAGHPNAGNGSKILNDHFNYLAECTSATGSNAPQTIVFGTLGTNVLAGCTGVLDFSMGSLAFATSNWTATGGTGSFIFTGSIAGDFNLNNASVGTGGSRSVSAQGAISYGKSLLNASNGNTSPNAGDFFSTTLTGSITVNLNPGGAATLGAAQRKTIIIKQAAAGGPFTVTWPHTGSPTTSAPTVNWPGGTAPTMTATASAVDVYKLETYDGATWYGQALQNVS